MATQPITSLNAGRLSADASELKRRLIGLDLLRLLAVMLVLGTHLSLAPAGLDSAGVFFQTWSRGGWVGVDLFFVLSGFLVSGLLFSEYKSRRTLSLARFFIRRGGKIYPPFYTLIAATVLIAVLNGRPIFGWPFFSEIFFLQSYIPGLWGHTWSLAVEEHFYLMLPIALVLMLKLNPRSPTPLRPVLYLTACAMIGCLALRFAAWAVRPTFDPYAHQFPTHLRLDALFFGVAISYAYYFHAAAFSGLKPWRWLMIVAGIALLSPAFMFSIDAAPFITTIGLTAFYLGSGLLLMGILHCAIPRHPILTSLAAVGAYSYSIYLGHIPIIWRGMPRLEAALGRPLNFGTWAAIYLIGSLGIGIILAKIIEVPALRLRDRWFPAR